MNNYESVGWKNDSVLLEKAHRRYPKLEGEKYALDDGHQGDNRRIESLDIWLAVIFR